MRWLVLVLFGVILAVPVGASAECRDSASGAMSVDVTLSPLSGIRCLHDVEVHRGAGCGGAAVWRATLGCDETRRMEVSDGGVLVNLRAPRVHRRDWEIVRTFSHERGDVVVRSIRLAELPGLPPALARARPRMNLGPGGVRVGDGPSAVLVPMGRIVGLGRRTGRR